ncbi:superoxide dismutase [Crocosphaera sp. Alani8]|uniref:superoxide dismutase n=1 Tax=Crocosphaera sp. Alani8 TaxID=3038952 RepID=UPI00313E315B
MKLLDKFYPILFVVVVLLCFFFGYPQSINSATSVTPTRIDLLAQTSSGEFVQSPLSYGFNGLQPSIDEKTMKIHYSGHHAGYLSNLKEAISQYPQLKGETLSQLLENLDRVPKDIRNSVRNNGGGHYNHTLFWSIMSPDGGGQPNGELASAINQTFGSFDQFRQQFNAEGKKVFGSGWIWLTSNSKGQLEISSQSGQDNPILEGKYPILGVDVWEHAYYLNYKNARLNYLEEWWNLVDWNEVSARYQESQSLES